MPNRLRLAAHVTLAVLAVAAAARVDVPVPGSPVPQSLQTLAVVVVGAWLGARWGAVALVAYVVAGAAGLPVFADGAAGLGALLGPTGGYLGGFVLGAAISGLVAHRLRVRARIPVTGAALGTLFAVAIGAHLVILGLGWARLSTLLGASEAFAAGVSPFLWGGVAKSAVAVPLIVMVERLAPLHRREGHPEEDEAIRDVHELGGEE
ncbi:MAG: biotin transporter BioY [Gemmatimonadota bacterium]